MRFVSTVVIGCTLLTGCVEKKISGIAFLHIAEVDGVCPPPQDETSPPDLRELSLLPFRRAHAVAAFEGGSAWAGGNVVAIAWRDDDGTIGRLYYDVAPERGFGVTHPTWSDATHGAIEYPETTGYVEWRGAERRFAAKRAYGKVIYLRDSPTARLDLGETYEPGEFFSQEAYEGVDATGTVRCRVIAAHATPDRERVDAYDPTWLMPNPTVMLSVSVEPTLTGDSMPTSDVVAPSLAPADPGGVPPEMEVKHGDVDDTNSGNGGNACD